MLNIKVKDIQLLKNKNIKIEKLQKIIDESEEVKKIKKIKKELDGLNEKIKKYSTYDPIQIGRALAKIMEAFEGIPYSVKESSFFINCNYLIEPVENNIEFWNIYNDIKIKSIKERFLNKEDIRETCIMPPTGYDENKNFPIYIQMFIDYLYERRTSKNLDDITNQELENIGKEFLELTKKLQDQRKNEIKKEKKSQEKKLTKK